MPAEDHGPQPSQLVGPPATAMTTIEKLTPAGFQASHPNIKVKFVT